jgi:plastocyanin
MKWSKCVAATAAGVALSACSGQNPAEQTSAQSTPPPATSTPSAPPSSAGSEITVTETEYRITLPQTTLKPGAYTFTARNGGNAPHDLVIKGPGVDSARTEILPGGQEGGVSVTLQPGEYELWCSVGNHRANGMVTTLTVG